MKELTETDKATEFLNLFQNEFKQGHSNLQAILIALTLQTNGVQRRVLNGLKPKLHGRPKNPITENMWLSAFDEWRRFMLDILGYEEDKLTDLEVIKHWLTHTDTRDDRDLSRKFNANRKLEKSEIKRIRDKISRARNRKKPLEK